MSNFLPQDYLFTIGPILVLSFALSAVAVSYVFLLVRFNKSEKDKVFLQSKIRDQTADILKDAHEKRLKIIREAMDRSHSILKELESFNVDFKYQFAEDLQAVRKKQEEAVVRKSDEISRLYSEFSTNLERGIEEQFNNMTKDMLSQSSLEVEEFRKTLEAGRIDIRKELKDRLDVEYKKAQKNIEDYKVDQIKKVDKHVFGILQALTRDVLGKSLSLKDHEDLVQKALSEMKAEMNSE